MVRSTACTRPAARSRREHSSPRTSASCWRIEIRRSFGSSRQPVSAVLRMSSGDAASESIQDPLNPVAIMPRPETATPRSDGRRSATMPSFASGPLRRIRLRGPRGGARLRTREGPAAPRRLSFSGDRPPHRRRRDEDACPAVLAGGSPPPVRRRPSAPPLALPPEPHRDAAPRAAAARRGRHTRARDAGRAPAKTHGHRGRDRQRSDPRGARPRRASTRGRRLPLVRHHDRLPHARPQRALPRSARAPGAHGPPRRRGHGVQRRAQWPPARRALGRGKPRARSGSSPASRSARQRT